MGRDLATFVQIGGASRSEGSRAWGSCRMLVTILYRASANVLCKGLSSKHLRLRGPYSLLQLLSLPVNGMKSATDNM